ncbi:MAG: hypothetical protein A2293_12970 [Elusimicrobia bacterium RIFOXYB2_FULL_49_7]|nr:MAG: hypothetical protein A2293_12970 [Elusimicrobia bacterium RIFOXYB2_FULL_49_7]
MSITALIAQYATAFIDATGYWGVTVLMTLESMVFPIPSEAVMPFAGFLIESGRFSFAGVIFFATVGSLIGSLLSYWIGRYGGKPFINRFGKYLLLDEEELAWTESFFQKRGEVTIFISRFIPVVRHLISIPAGIGKMPIVKFCFYSVIGAGLWNSFLTVVGYYLKKNWTVVMKYSHIVDVVVVVILAGLVAMYVVRHVKKRALRQAQRPSQLTP